MSKIAQPGSGCFTQLFSNTQTRCKYEEMLARTDRTWKNSEPSNQWPSENGMLPIGRFWVRGISYRMHLGYSGKSGHVGSIKKHKSFLAMRDKLDQRGRIP